MSLNIEHQPSNIPTQALPVAEEFYTIQGEGCHAGRAAYFIRLAGCDVVCPWCDSKGAWSVRAGILIEVAELVRHAQENGAQIAVITGGEPCLHPLEPLCHGLRSAGIRTHLETSGVYAINGKWNWICLSPKPHRPPMLQNIGIAHELKVVVSGESDIRWAELLATKTNVGCRLLLQPNWDERDHALPLIVDYVKHNPQWRISLQTHKYMQIP